MSRLAVMSVLVFCGTVGCGRITFDPVAFYNPYAKPPAEDGGTSVLDPYANQDAGLSIGLPECGNGILEIREACDGLDLGETSCASFLMDGDLACDEHCDLDLSGCISTTGGGGSEDGGTGVLDGGQPQKFLHLWRWNHRTARSLTMATIPPGYHLRHLRGLAPRGR